MSELSYMVNGGESAETPSAISSPVVQPESTDSLTPKPEETREIENKEESDDMYKTSTTIEVNGRPSKKDTSSRSTTSIPNSSCSTTIVVNTSPKPGPKFEKSKVVENGETKGEKTKSEPTTPTHTVPGSPSSTRYTPPPQGPMFKAKAPNAVWTPGHTTPPAEPTAKEIEKSRPTPTNKYRDDETGPVWQPFGAVPEEKLHFKSIKLESSSTRVQKSTSESGQETSRSEETSVKKMTQKLESVNNSNTAETNGTTVSPTSPFTRLSSSKLPQSQSPTVILLQKAREGQIPKGALYIDELNAKDGLPQDGLLIDQKKTIDADRIHTDSYYALPLRDVTSTTKTLPAPAKYQGIGPTERGIPTCLRTAVKDEYASDWYKTMYRSLHKSEKSDADYVTLKFNKKGHVPHAGGYMSEPEIDKEDEYPHKFSTVDYRRRPPERTVSENIQQRTQSHEKTESQTNPYLPPPTRLYQDVYKNQPRSIADYEPGNSSISEREERMFWADFWEAIDEMEKDDGDDGDQQKKYLPPLNQPKPSYVYRDGYESDSTLFRRTGKAQSLDPLQQKVLYRKIQQGSDIPFSGLGKPAPDKIKEDQTGCKLSVTGSMPKAASSASPHKYQETEVNIHYRSPIRTLEKEFIEEEELRKRQEEAMKRFYEEERYKKQLQQLAEIENRRHNDYFIPSQKSPIPLNRYDNPFELSTTPPPKTPEARTVGRALFNFTAQTARELSFNKGDIVYVIRKIDRNWYEGEHHGMIGIFPIKYIEVIPQENANLQPRKVTEGLARVRYNFRAQTPVELSLFKGEKVCLMRRVDQNWYEGRIGTKKGIFPSSYVEIVREPEESVTSCVSPKPPASPVYGPIVNGSHTTRQTHFLHSHSYPQGLSTNDTNFHTVQEEKKRPLMQSLHIDTSNDPIPYRGLYNYRPQNEDELELEEGDTVYVMEKCDDGWYVGTSLRTGLFGTFPGNYVERI